MPILVHLADERDKERIKKNGIKVGKQRPGIFCMPVLPNFYVSHQWLRELKRNGAKTFVGVYFKLDKSTLVYAGKYNEGHQQLPLGEAIKQMMHLKDPLGFELIVPIKIEAKEINKIKSLPQTLGWRYYPGSHLKKPACACPVCIPKGAIKGRRLKDKIEPVEKKLTFNEIINQLKAETDENEIENLLWEIKNFPRRADPTQLAFLLNKNSNQVNQSLALTLGVFKHRNTKGILLGLLKSVDDDTKEYAADSLMKIYGLAIKTFLLETNDPVICKAVDEFYD
jgi:hypothetical protein